MKEAGRPSDAGPVYLGVDVAGAKNTWVSALSQEDNGLAVVHGPQPASLKAIVGYCEGNDVVAASIDAQLTVTLSDERGLRTPDVHLRRLLPRDCRNWVMSFNSLMAVPIRGRLLADHLSPTVGTILETHPRASLCFGLGHVEQTRAAIREYKSERVGAEVRRTHVRTLWEHWSARFGITHDEDVRHDGALDSLVCATVAYLFHHAPGELHKLRHDAPGRVGRGPFYVVSPATASRSWIGKTDVG